MRATTLTFLLLAGGLAPLVVSAQTQQWSAPANPTHPSAPAVHDSAGNAYRPGDHVWVTWTGSSYKARILEANQGRYLIRYDGYDSKWDEWVGPGRITGRVEAAATSARRDAGSNAPSTTSAPEAPAAPGGVLGRWECATWDAGQLNRIGGFTLADGGTYTDLNSGRSGRYTFQAATGQIAFTSGPQRTNVPVTFRPEARQGRGMIVFDYGGGARLDCYRAAR